MIAAAVLFLFCILLSAVAVSVFWFLQLRFGRTVDLDPDSVFMRLFARPALGTLADGTAAGSPSNETDTTTAHSELDETPREFNELDYSDACAYVVGHWKPPVALGRWWDLYDNPVRLYTFRHAGKPASVDIRRALAWAPTVCYRPSADVEKLSKPDLTELAVLIKKEFDGINRRLEAIEDAHSPQNRLMFHLREMPEESSKPVRPN